jgi:hypothetical protein
MSLQPVLMSFFGDDYGTLGFNFGKIRKNIGKFARKTPAGFAVKGAKRLLKGKPLLHPMSGTMASSLFLGTDIPWNKTANYYYDDQGNLYMGSLLSWAKGAVKKIGKITSPITTAIAKKFLPDSVVNSMAKIDPTKGTPKMQAVVASVQSMLPQNAKSSSVPTETQQTISAIGKTAMNPMVLAIAGAGVLAIILMSKRRR